MDGLCKKSKDTAKMYYLDLLGNQPHFTEIISVVLCWIKKKSEERKIFDSDVDISEWISKKMISCPIQEDAIRYRWYALCNFENLSSASNLIEKLESYSEDEYDVEFAFIDIRIELKFHVDLICSQNLAFKMQNDETECSNMTQA